MLSKFFSNIERCTSALETIASTMVSLIRTDDSVGEDRSSISESLSSKIFPSIPNFISPSPASVECAINSLSNVSEKPPSVSSPSSSSASSEIPDRMDCADNIDSESALAIFLEPDEREHREFDTMRKKSNGKMKIQLSEWNKVWPSAVIALMEFKTTGQLEDTQRSYLKVVKCCGVLTCPECGSTGRPCTTNPEAPLHLNGALFTGKHSQRYYVCHCSSSPIRRVYTSCPGVFRIKREKKKETIEITALTPCNSHPYPPRIHPTGRELNQMKPFLLNGTKVPMHKRGLLEKLNNQRYHQFAYKIKNANSLPPQKLLSKIQDLGDYHSDSNIVSLALYAPYENDIVSVGSTIHVDSTYKVVKPGDENGNDYRSGMQLISMTCFSKELQKYVLLRGTFSKPTTQETYELFFYNFFSAHGLPSKNSYFGISADFSTHQIQGFVVAYVKFKMGKNAPKDILSNKKLVESALKYWRGCRFHFEKAVLELKTIVPDTQYAVVSGTLRNLMSAVGDEYKRLDNVLLEQTKIPGMKNFLNWLAWCVII